MESPRNPASLTSLPTELLQLIFQYLPPESLLAVSQTSKAIHTIANAPIIWRHLCQTRFQSWAPRHNIAAKYAGPLSNVDWRDLYIQRIYTERSARNLIEGVLESQAGRIAKMEGVSQFGRDIVELIFREYYNADKCDDVLARRFYARRLLERIQREEAAQIWQDVADGKDVPLEMALNVYDMFTRTGPTVGTETVVDSLDLLADDFRKRWPDYEHSSPREQALLLVSFLRDRGFQGVSDESYKNLQNSFIGLVLTTQGHESLPLINVAIYCAVARRLRIDARPCGFPFHVYCLVYAPQGLSLDGHYVPGQREPEVMYIDPFRSENEVPQDHLRDILRDMNVPVAQRPALLSDSNTREMVLRTARNIMNSVQTIRQTEPRAYGIRSTWAYIEPDMDNSFYVALWATLLLGHQRLGDQPLNVRPAEYLPFLLDNFQAHSPWDVSLLEKYIIPLFNDQPDRERLQGFVRAMRNLDLTPRPKHRSTEVQKKVKYKVGQLFQHRRYMYEGVITGWDTTCDAGEEWIQHMGVDALAKGRHQSFYHVLVCDKSIRYVAEENISVKVQQGYVRPHPSPAMLKLAGRYFKRWDPVECVFVSNITDEYPDG